MAMHTMRPTLPPIICLMGATATGKTDCACYLAKRLPVGIISVDSAMVYRGMDIGTAKPKPSILKQAPHRLIDICDPIQAYSAGNFRADALDAIKALTQQGLTPLLVGGTPLYFHVLQQGVAQLPPANPAIRDRLNRDTEQMGCINMYQRLCHIDTTTAAQIHCHDIQRIQRALEVYELTGRTMTELQQQNIHPPLPYRVINIVLELNRPQLHARIAKRFADMLEQGLLSEVSQLQQRKDLHDDLPSIKAVGYRQAWAHLKGLYDAETMFERALAASRQLAKRQITWLRRWQSASRYSVEKDNWKDRICQDLANMIDE